MPVQLPDDANPGDPGHVNDHNVIIDAIEEMRADSATHLKRADVVAGANITLTPGAGNSVTVAATTGGTHTHQDYIDADAALQDSIDALDAAIAALQPIETVSPGTAIVVDKAKANFGSVAGSWPTARPSVRTDITVIWKGNTDPALLVPNPVLANDIWFQTP